MVRNMNKNKDDYNNYLITLVDMVQKGEKHAVLKIFDALKPLIYKHGRNIGVKYGGSKKEYWDEHLQNLYIEIYYCALKFDIHQNTKFTYYATRCIRNYFYNYFVKNLNLQIQERSLDEQTCSSNDDGGNLALIDILTDETAYSVEEQLCKSEVCEDLCKALGRLNMMQKKFIYFAYVKNFPMTKIAENFGINYQAVRRLKNKTLEILKNYINNPTILQTK